MRPTPDRRPLLKKLARIHSGKALATKLAHGLRIGTIRLDDPHAVLHELPDHEHTCMACGSRGRAFFTATWEPKAVGGSFRISPLRCVRCIWQHVEVPIVGIENLQIAN